MSSSISGNAGGPNASGADVFATPSHLKIAPLLSIISVKANQNGDFTFSQLTADTYVITASTSGITSGPYVGFVYRKSVSVQVDGVNNFTGVVVPNPVAKNSPITK